MMETWQDIKERWENDNTLEGEALYRQARTDILALCNAVTYQMDVETGNAKIIDLLKSDGDFVIKNMSNRRRMSWYRGEWVIGEGDRIKPLYSTTLFNVALKWLKGEE